MRDDIDAYTELGATIVVVAPHTREEVGAYWQENDLPYTGIPDPEGVVSKRYGQQWKLIRLGRMPAQFVTDCNGAIVFAHYASGMSDISTTETVLAVLRGLEGCAKSN